nr:MAG TPA: hypothetical protein [Crassvirales sp.]
MKPFDITCFYELFIIVIWTKSTSINPRNLFHYMIRGIHIPLI